MMTNIKNLKLFFQSLIFILISFPFHLLSAQTDTLTLTSPLKDPDSLKSPNDIFEFGFFTIKNTTHRYLGVYYAVSKETVVWVANKDKPLKDSSGTVTISKHGDIVLRNGRNETLWSTNITTTASINTTAQIQDTGNVVLRDTSTGNILWDAFAYPSNNFLPTMRVIDNVRTGQRVVVSAWKNETDPEYGSFTSGLEAKTIPQIFIWNNGRPHWRSGPWNGQILIGVQDMYSPYLDGFSVVNNGSDTFYFMAPQGKFLMRISLNSSGSVIQTLWDDQKKSWDITWVAPQNECEIYGKCGDFGSCNAREDPICSCLKGFEPAKKDEWRRGIWSSGCTRRKELECDRKNISGEGFLRLQFMKVPDFAEQMTARSEEECGSICLGNCSCIAYAYDPNIGCMFWREKLVDLQRFSGVGTDLYVRLPASELDDHKDKKLVIIIPLVVGFVILSICVLIAWYCMARRRKGAKTKDQETVEGNQTFSSSADSNTIVLKDESEKINIQELPLFTFDTLANATNQFDDDNMLGKGGFGPVYMGKLANGKEIAVKRLSAASGQGAHEFMNEVIVISKLQHRNLVRLIGCCVEREEKMLIYEYMPNKSLDMCLFDPDHPSQKILNWTKRFSIIEGIGRGLLYLHRDSRLRIIHRDLKPSNVLLDGEWNPKISDFGMARIFGGNEDQANTARVVGTYGYMAPEYAMEGRFSEKSDVYSFGVLILEIVSGKKNTHYYNQEWSLSLLGCAWKLWSEDNSIAFVDNMVLSSDFHEEMVRCIHIALLCVQEFPKDRPGIQTVLSMLSREIVDLPVPEQPVFAEKWNRFHVGSSQPTNSSQVGYSINELTITVLDGR